MFAYTFYLHQTEVHLEMHFKDLYRSEILKTLIRSDNGTNFIAGHSQMSDVNLNDIQNQISNQCIEWLFKSPYASHFGDYINAKQVPCKESWKDAMLPLGLVICYLTCCLRYYRKLMRQSTTPCCVEFMMIWMTDVNNASCFI